MEEKDIHRNVSPLTAAQWRTLQDLEYEVYVMKVSLKKIENQVADLRRCMLDDGTTNG